MTDYASELLAPPEPAEAPPEGEAPAGRDYASELLGGAPEAPEAEAEPVERQPAMKRFTQGALDLLYMGYADEAEAFLRSKVGGEDYDAALQDVRSRQEGPAYYGGMASGAVAGSVTAPAQAAGRFIMGSPRLAGQMARAAGVGSAAGAITGAGDAQGDLEDRAKGAAIGAAVGAPLGAAGQAVAHGIGKVINRGVAPDLGSFDEAATEALERKAAKEGVELTAAEATNLPSLKAEQHFLGNRPGSSDVMQDFAERRTDQIGRAVGKQLEKISPVQGVETAGEMARAASNRAMDAVAQLRADQARPLYNQAFAEAPSVNVAPILDSIDGKLSIAKGSIESGLKRVKSLLMRQAPDGSVVPEDRLEALHMAKMAIDDMLETARESGAGRTAKRAISDVKGQLLSAMDNASPSYRDARAIFSDMSPGVERVREGVAGTIAEMNDLGMRKVATRLFSKGSIGPQEAKRAGALIKAADPDAWQAIKRAFIEEQWIKAGRETLSADNTAMRGARFRKMIMGDLEQKRILAATLEPNEFKALSDLGDVLEATGRVPLAGSKTAWNQIVDKGIQSDAEGVFLKSLRLVSLNAFENAAEMLRQGKVQGFAEQLAQTITDPSGSAAYKLKKLKAMKMPAQAKLAIGMQAMGLMGQDAARAFMSPHTTVETVTR